MATSITIGFKADPPPAPLPVPIPCTTAPHLLRIPGEIRNQIYKEFLVFSEPVPVFREPQSPPLKAKTRRRPNPVAAALSILLACRQCHHEAAAIFYSSNTFSLPRGAAGLAPLQVQHNLLGRRFLDRIGERNASLLRRLVLPFPADPVVLVETHWHMSEFSATSATTKPNSSQLRRSRRQAAADNNPLTTFPLIASIRARCPNLEFLALDTSPDNHWLRLLRPHACAVRAVLAPIDAALREEFPRLGHVELWVGDVGPRGRRGGRRNSSVNARDNRWSWTSVVEVIPPGSRGGEGGGNNNNTNVWNGVGEGENADNNIDSNNFYDSQHGVGFAARAAMTRREWRWVRQVVQNANEDADWQGWNVTVAVPEVGWDDEEEEEEEEEEEQEQEQSVNEHDNDHTNNETHQDHHDPVSPVDNHPNSNNTTPRYIHQGRDTTHLLYGPPELALRSEIHDHWTPRTLWLRFAAAFVRSPTAARRELREAREWLAWKRAMIAQAGPPLSRGNSNGSGTSLCCFGSGGCSGASAGGGYFGHGRSRSCRSGLARCCCGGEGRRRRLTMRCTVVERVLEKGGLMRTRWKGGQQC